MTDYRLFAAILLSTVAWGADLRISVPPNGLAESSVVLSAKDLESKLVIWVQADPKQIEVSVIAPDGKRWTQADYRAGAMVRVQLADSGSGSSDEIYSARELGSNGTLIRWSDSAAAGKYRVQLSGSGLAAAVEVFLRRLTAAEFIQDLQAIARRREKETLASIFATPERRVPLDEQGRASTILPRWEQEDAIVLGTTANKQFTVSIKLPDGETITAANAKQMDCQWDSDTEEAIFVPIFLKTAEPHLEVTCPKRKVDGAVLISIDAGPQSHGAEMAVAVVSTKGLGACRK